MIAAAINLKSKSWLMRINHDLLFKFIAAAIISVSFLYLQGGHFVDVITALVAGAFGYLVVEVLDRNQHPHRYQMQ